MQLWTLDGRARPPARPDPRPKGLCAPRPSRAALLNRGFSNSEEHQNPRPGVLDGHPGCCLRRCASGHAPRTPRQRLCSGPTAAAPAANNLICTETLVAKSCCEMFSSRGICNVTGNKWKPGEFRNWQAAGCEGVASGQRVPLRHLRNCSPWQDGCRGRRHLQGACGFGHVLLRAQVTLRAFGAENTLVPAGGRFVLYSVLLRP